MNELKAKIKQSLAERNIFDINGDLAEALHTRFSDGERWSDAVTFDEALTSVEKEANRLSQVFGRNDSNTEFIENRVGGRMPREVFSELSAQQQSDFCLRRVSEANGK